MRLALVLSLASLAAASCGGGPTGTGTSNGGGPGGNLGGTSGGAAGRGGNVGSAGRGTGGAAAGSAGTGGSGATGGGTAGSIGSSGAAGMGGSAAGNTGSGGRGGPGGSAAGSTGSGGRGGAGGSAAGNAGRAGNVGSGGRGGTGGSTAGSAGSGGRGGTGGSAAGSTGTAGQGGAGPVATIAGCQIFPANHIFNTKIDALPVDPNSAAYLATIGTHNIHLDLGTSVDVTAADYYGIPYNVVHGNALTWAHAFYKTTDTADLAWDPTTEADCASGTAHTLVSPCTASAAPQPLFPIPSPPLCEGGIDTTPSQPYGDHHILMLDADTCRLWELYHAYPDPSSGWDIFGSASFDLRSNALRPAGWTSADAAGFPILPLLLRADEASTGTITHALRFTIDSNHIRTTYIWPARHLTGNGTASTNLPPMGQLFRIKASYAIPTSFGVQSRAIVQALKTYGMYIADGGSPMYVTGEPSASWADTTFSQVQSISSSQFEAVDISPIMGRAGWSANSATVP